jgi:hypothetical protein
MRLKRHRPAQVVGELGRKHPVDRALRHSHCLDFRARVASNALRRRIGTPGVRGETLINQVAPLHSTPMASGRLNTCCHEPVSHQSNNERSHRERERPGSHIVQAPCEPSVGLNISLSQNAFGLIHLEHVQAARIIPGLKLLCAPFPFQPCRSIAHCTIALYADDVHP